jgi:hypothetical protein
MANQQSTSRIPTETRSGNPQVTPTDEYTHFTACDACRKRKVESSTPTPFVLYKNLIQSAATEEMRRPHSGLPALRRQRPDLCLHAET